MSKYVHVVSTRQRVLSRFADVLRVGPNVPRALCGESLVDPCADPTAVARPDPLRCPECLIAESMPKGYRAWRVEHELTKHYRGPHGIGIYSTEELLAQMGALIAAFVLVPLPWAIPMFWLAGLVLHIWLHSHDRCGGGCGNG